MKIVSFMTGCLFIAILASGCGVMPAEIKDQAMSSVPFDQLIAQAGQYKGQMVIVGGYLVSVENLDRRTRMVAVQAPLGADERPKSKDLTQGRLLLVYNGFLDPEVFTKDRRITAGGRIMESSADDSGAPYPYLQIEADTIHLWPVETPAPPDPFWYDDLWYPHPWRWHPYWRHRYW